MSDSSYSEAEAAAMLPGRPHERTLRRWRQAGKVPFCRTPGGRIRYTFGQLLEIGAAMRVEAGQMRPPEAADARLCPDTSEELRRPPE